MTDNTELIELERVKDILKTDVTICDVAERLGILDKYNITRTGNTYLGDCPTGHPSENHQCFGLNLQDNYFHCFNCDIAGDIISLVELVQNTGYKQAILWLSEQFQPDLAGNIKQLTFERSPKEAELYQRHIVYEKIYQYGKQLLYQNAGKDALAALTGRGYDEEHLKQTDWIYWPYEAEIKKHAQGVSLTGHFGDNFRLAFPYRNRHGIITGFIKRSTERNGFLSNEGKLVRYDSTPGLDKSDLFGLHRIHGEKTLIVVEGYPDALYMPALGVNNVVALGQAVLSREHVLGLKLRKIQRVILALDNDDVGPGNTEKALQLLAEADIEAFVIDPKAYGTSKDPDEYISANGIEQFKQLADNPTSGARWMASRILSEFDITTDIGKKDALTESFDYANVLNNPVDTKAIVDILASGLQVPVQSLEPFLEEYQDKKAQEKLVTQANKLINTTGTLLYKGQVEEAVELLTVKPRELALEYQHARINKKDSFGVFLKEKKESDMRRTPGQLLGYDLKKFRTIAQYMCGIQPGYYILGADPNVGKTAFLVNLAIDLISTNPLVKVFFYSMDDDRSTIVNRILAMLTGLEINQVQCQQADRCDQLKLDQAYGFLNDMYERGRLVIKDIAEMDNVDDLEIEIRKIKGKENLVVFVDGLYNMNVTGESRSVREENIKRATRMKELTKSNNIPLIATAELRKRDQTQDKNKQRSGHDIMETGKYQYNADVIWLIAPEDYEKYDQENEPVIRLKFEKNKLAGFRGIIDLKFIRAKSTFEELQSATAFANTFMKGVIS